MTDSTCPICGTRRPHFERYPRYLCDACSRKATSAEGRPLRFQNLSLSGGYAAFYADDQQPYESHECFVNGVRCHADEARFGGIVIQPVDP